MNQLPVRSEIDSNGQSFSIQDLYQFVMAGLFPVSSLSIVQPVNPYRMVMTGEIRQNTANGKYSMVETPNTSVRKIPQTLHGTSGFTTVPASSNVRESVFG